MRDDQFAGLVAFASVADKKSFTAAGADLGVTPSAVSQTVKQLEERLGVRLLQRTTRSVGLTEAGQVFLERIRPSLAGLTDALVALRDSRDRPAGKLRLNIPRVASVMFVEPVLAAFMAEYSDIEVDLVVDDALTNIVAGGFDAGLRLGERLEKDMIGVRVGGQQRMAVVASPGYFERRGRPRRPEELHAHECIRFRYLSSGTVYKWEFEDKGREFEVEVPGRLITNDADLMLRAARDGMGVAYLIEDYVRDDIRQGRLVRVLQKFCTPFQGFYLYYPSRAQLPRKLQVFVDFLRRHHS
jgi:DNA-binding transcriptional LysR family regulator